MSHCASGWEHSLFLDHSGSVWSCGKNQFGELGLEEKLSKWKAEKINSLPIITAISAGSQFSLFLDESGCVWSCGKNEYGELGLGNAKQTNQPQKITGMPRIMLAFALGRSSLFLDYSGSVWVCGFNGYGQLGLGDNTYRSKVDQVKNLPKIKFISGGFFHSLFLDFEGCVWSCGRNSDGELALGHKKDANKPEKVRGLPRIKQMAGGVYFSLFLDEEGYVWACGSNFHGELGLGHNRQICEPERINSISGIIAIASQNGSSVFLDKKGALYTCGKNWNGQLGFGDKENRNVPQRVTDVPPIAFLATCNASENYFQVVDFEGKVWSCGFNENGQLGLGDCLMRVLFVRIETLPKIKPQIMNCEGIQHLITSNSLKKETEIFKMLASKELNKELATEIISYLPLPHNRLERDVIKEIISGVIGTSDWSSKWKDIRIKNQHLALAIEQHKVNLNNKQQQLDKLAQEIREIHAALSAMEEQKQTLEFFDEFVEPIAEIDKELKSGFEEKLKAGKHGDWSVDEVSMFLNVCGMSDLVSHQRANKLGGEFLKAAMSDISLMKIQDPLSARKLECSLRVLESGKMLNGEELEKSIVWRHREVHKTIALLKEWEIALDMEVVRKKEISICQLIFFAAADFEKVFGGQAKAETVEKLRDMRKDFEKLLKG